nr:hypothetical protein [Deinococcus apachensis]
MRQFHKHVGKKTQAPLCATLRRITGRQGNDVRFESPVHFAGLVDAGPAGLEGCLKRFVNETLPDPQHRLSADPKLLGNLFSLNPASLLRSTWA